MRKSVVVAGTLCALLVIGLTEASCTSSSEKQSEATPTQSAASATATGEATEAAEAAAKAFVEAWETFDYRDQEARYNRVLPLLAAGKRSQYPGFHENAYARMYELTGTTSVTASQVTDASGNDVTVAVTTKRFRHFVAQLAGPSSQVIEQSSLENMECHFVQEGGQWLVTKWQIVSERLFPSEATPTPFGTTPSPYAWDPVISMVARDFTESYSSAIAEDVWSGERGRYTDSSGTVWVRFGGLSHWYANDQFVTEPFSGIMKERSENTWELVTIGSTSDVACGLPADVQSALQFLVCAPGPQATAWAQDDEQADQAVKGSASSGYNARVDDKRYYTDSDGSLWLMFDISPVPNDLTDPARGFMVKLPDGWRRISGPGTAMMECDVPVEVQTAFGYGTCLPDEAELDQAIKTFIDKNQSQHFDRLIVDGKYWDDSSSSRDWVQAAVLLVRSNQTEQVYVVMRKREDGTWEGVAGPSSDQATWCDVPAALLSNLRAAGRCPTPTPPAS